MVNEGGKGLVKPEQNDVKLLKRSASLPEGKFYSYSSAVKASFPGSGTGKAVGSVMTV